MNKGLVAGLVGGLVALGLAGALVVAWIGTSNEAIALEQQFKAQVEANKSTYDKMWKVLSQKAEITDKYQSDFRAAYAAIMQGRYGNNQNFSGSLFQWIQERNPQMSAQMFQDLSQSVEALRGEFDLVQRKLVDIKREHDLLRLQFPSRLFVGSRPELDLKLVLSSRTQESFETGVDNDVKLFKDSAK